MTLPDSLLHDLRAVKGFDEAAFIAAHQAKAITSVRFHPVKGAAADLQGSAVPWCMQGIYLPDRPVFTLDPAFHGGAYYVQEASSMFLAHVWKSLMPETHGLRVLDLCAAPGGKSTLIASLLDQESLLISNEVIRTRATILEENITRWGYTNNWVTCNDPRDFSKLDGYFDVIVIDAPCSGSGLFRKDARALDEWSEDNVAICAARQHRIIADIWPALKKDGLLIYATCSFSPQEDELLLDKLAEEYALTSLTVPLQDEWGIIEVTSPQHGLAGYRFFPDKAKGEGFFIAILQKQEAAAEMRPVKYKPQNLAKIQAQASYLFKNNDLIFVQADKEDFNAIHAAHEADWLLLQKLYYFRKTGLTIGQPSAKEWIPAHDTALSTDLRDDVPAIHVNREQALRFLKREDMEVTDTGKGWHVVKFNNIGLGWVKALGNRMNNYLPKHWRIRMDLPTGDNP